MTTNKAIEILKSYKTYTFTSEEKYKESISVDEIIELLQKPTRVGEWIPVSERLPEDGEDVLVTIFFHGLTVKHKNGRVDYTKPNYYVEIASRIDGKWISDSADYKVGKHEVIAWMPLPKSFMEKRDG